MSSPSPGSATGNPRNKVALKPGHSLMDWIRLGQSGQDLSGTRGTLIDVSPSQLARHNQIGDAWLSIRGVVYNVTRYLDFHPGGVDELMKGAGKDATALFSQVHPWVNYESILKKCMVGRLHQSVEEDIFSFGGTSNSNQLGAKKEDKSSPKPKNENCIASKIDWYQQLTYITFVFYLKQPVTKVIVDNRVKGELRVTVDDWCGGWEIKGEPKWPPYTTLTNNKLEVKVIKSKLTIWPEPVPLSSPSLSESEPWQLTVVSVSPLNHNVYLICLKPVERLIYHIPVGYHLIFSADIKGVSVERPYTPIRKVTGGELTIGNIWLMVKQYNDGQFSSWICRAHPGETLSASYPMGSFSTYALLSSTLSHLILLAAGSGLTPMLSVTDWALRNTKLNVSLKFFNKTEKDIVWRDEFDRLEAQNPRFSVEHILSEYNASWNGKKGWITLQLLQGFIPDFSQDVPQEHYVCVCGPISFTQLSERYLQDMGYSSQHYFCFRG